MEEKRSPLATIMGIVAVLFAVAIIYLLYALSNVGPNLSPDVAALKSQVTELEARPQIDAAGMTKRLGALDAAVGAAKASIETVGKRVDGLAATPPVAQPAAVADLTPRLADLDGQVSALKQGIADLRTTISDLPKPDFGPVEAKIGDLDQRLNALSGTVSAIPRIDLGPLTAKVDALETRLKPVEAEADASKSPQRVAERQAAPTAVTAQAVLDALSAGRAFPREFKALQVLGADPVRLAPLQAVAEAGAPALSDLQADLGRLRDRIVAEGTPQASGSYVDRIMSGAGRLVQVRPLGSVVGDTPAAIVARMDADIGADDFKAALAEWQALPEASRTASKALAERITLRLDAETAARSIAANAIAAMTAPKG